jgi:hypothetical protein
MAQLRLELLQEEAKYISNTDDAGPQKISPGAFFRKAIDIEERL